MPRPDPQEFARARRAAVPWRALQAPVADARRGVAQLPDPPTEPSDRLPYPEIWGWPYGYGVRFTVPAQGYQGPGSETAHSLIRGYAHGTSSVSGDLAGV